MRAGILSAAQRVIARDGAERLTTVNVAREAGLSVGGLRYHFESKRDLLVALVDATVEGFDRAMASAGGAPGDRTRRYIAATLADTGTEASAGLIAAAAVDIELLGTVREHFRRWQRLLDDDGIDPAIATTVRLAMDGWWLAMFLDLAAPTSAETARIRAVLESRVDEAVRG